MMTFLNKKDVELRNLNKKKIYATTIAIMYADL